MDLQNETFTAYIRSLGEQSCLESPANTSLAGLERGTYALASIIRSTVSRAGSEIHTGHSSALWGWRGTP
jgi:hypothetical protein